MPFLAPLLPAIGSFAAANAGPLIGAGASLAGGLISSNAASKAQAGQNATNTAIANEQNLAEWKNYLLSRGVDPSGVTQYGQMPANPSAVNTTLPLGFNINGNPAEVELFNRILSAGSPQGAGAFGAQVAEQFPGLQAEWQRVRAAGDGRSFEQWLTDFVAENPQSNEAQAITQLQQQEYAARTAVPADIQGLQDQAVNVAQSLFGGTFNSGQYLANNADVAQGFERLNKDDQGRGIARINGELVPMTEQEWAQYHYETFGKGEGRDGSYSDSIYQSERDALGGVQNARLDLAALEQDRINEARLASDSIFDVEQAGLDRLLQARETGARGIYDAESGAAGDLRDARLDAATGLRDARDTGARGIYDADLLSADASEAAIMQSLNRALATQSAERARKGFAGSSSGDALVSARTLADGYTQSAGIRSKADQDLALRLAALGEGFAQDTGAAGVGYAGDSGGASINLARALGLTGEQDALGRLQSGSANATRKSSLLDADASIATGNAQLQNALDALGLLQNDNARKVSALTLPGTLFQQQTGLNDLASGQSYSGLDNILSRLGLFAGNNVSTPGYATPNVQTPINSGQIAGGALSSVGQGAFDYFSTQNLINSLNRGGGSGVTFGNSPSGATTITSGGYNPGGSTLTSTLGWAGGG